MEIAKSHQDIELSRIITGFYNSLLMVGAFLIILLGLSVIVVAARGMPAWLRY